MDVKPPMVISLAKKEELVYAQAKSEPVRLPRNNAGLKLLQYARDEAHRFAQHYHHILRRKTQLEEARKTKVTAGPQNPPGTKRGESKNWKPLSKTPPPAENPHTTLPSLPNFTAKNRRAGKHKFSPA